MKATCYEQFSADEYPFIERCTDWLQRAQNCQFITTPFLNPCEQYILGMLVNRVTGLGLHLDGGYSDAERCRAIVDQESFFVQPPEFPQFVHEKCKSIGERHNRVDGKKRKI